MRFKAAVENDDLFAVFRKAKDSKSGRRYTEKGTWTESVLLLAAGKAEICLPRAGLIVMVTKRRLI